MLTMVDVINGKACRGMSDAARDNEYGCQARLARAVYELEQAIIMVNAESVIEKISLNAWADFKHDELPDTRQWDEKIEAARHG